MFEERIGQTIDQLILLQKVRETSVEVIFWGRRVDLTREVTFRLVRPEISCNETFQSQFDILAKTGMDIDHPGLAKVIGSGHTSDDSQFAYLVTEWLPGSSLGELLSKLKTQESWISLGEAARLIQHLCLALDHARLKGFSRRLDPEHIRFRLQSVERLPYSPVIDDFGLENLIPDQIIRRNLLIPAYLSPEQAMNQPTDSRSDVYSLGILLFELVTGQLPFPIHTMDEAVRFHTRQPVPPPGTLRLDLPQPLEAVIIKALQKNPDNRYATPAEMADELNWALPLLEGIVTPPPAFEHTISLMGLFLESLGEHRKYAEGNSTTRGKSASPSVVDAAVAAAIISGTTPSTASNVAGIAAATRSQAVSKDEVEMALDQAQISVEPGRVASVTISVHNNSSSESYFMLGVEGLPSSWVTLSPREFPLDPGEQKTTQLVIRPPRATNTRAGRYPVSIRAVDSRKPSRSGQIGATLTVSVFHAYRSEMRTPQIRAEQTGSLTVTNGGNVPDNFTITCVDPSNELVFEPFQSQVRLNPGQVGQADFQVSLRSPRLFGGLHSHPYAAEVLASNGEKQNLAGEFLSKAILPIWVPLLLLFLCLCSSAGAIFWITSSNIRGTSIERTAVAIETGTALSATNTVLSVTQTADFLFNANQATIQSFTQTVDAGLVQTATNQIFGTATAQAVTATANSANATAQANATAAFLFTQEAYLRATQQASVNQTSTSVSTTATAQVGAFWTATAQSAFQTATAQVGYLQTATAQAMFRTATAQAALAQTSTAFSATLTAQAPKTPTPPPSRKLVYLYLTDIGLGRDYQDFLKNKGFTLDLIPIDSLPGWDLRQYSGILVGPDTGKDGTWGDFDGSWANKVRDSSLPVIGLGEGGFNLFGKLSLVIGWPSGVPISTREIIPLNSSDPVWSQPNPVSISGSNPITLYNRDSEAYASLVQSPIPANVLPLGQWPARVNQFPLIRQDGRYAFWGYKMTPREFTTKGANLFINLLEQMLSGR